jgi:hypothetical protein
MSEEPEVQEPKRRHRLGVSGLTLAVIGSLVSIVVVYHGGCVSDLASGAKNQREATEVVDHFMRLMTARKLNACPSLFSGFVSPTKLDQDLKLMVTGENYARFEGYQGVTSEGHRQFRSTGCMARIHTIEIFGPISYDDGSRGRFAAKLTKEGSGWSILSINLDVPPEKKLRSP